MLQVEIRANGVFIDCVNIENVSPTGLPDDSGLCLYLVVCGRRRRRVLHRQADGALKLAAVALTALTKRKAKA